MPFLGDLERFAATTLYPWRFAIAAFAIAAAAGFVILGARRGWLAAARRHPGRTGVLVAVAVVVLAPAAWYLGSPLLIRSELQEPPIVAVGPTPGPATLEPTAAAAAPTTAPPTARHRRPRRLTRRLLRRWSAPVPSPGRTTSISDAAAPR